MRALTWDDFAEAAGSVYTVPFGQGQVELTLDRVAEIASAGRSGGSFRLEFRGPVEPGLPQATYSFALGEETVEIFIVPIASDREGMRYEAIFY